MLLPIIEKYPLHDRGIKRLIDEGTLSIDPFPHDDQFQSATLDVRVRAAHVYDAAVRDRAQRDLLEKQEALIKKAGGNLEHVYAELIELEPDPRPIKYAAGSDILVPHNAFAELLLEESILLDHNNHYFEPELRSSRGRAHFEIESMTSLAAGTYRLSITNPNPNDLIIPGTSKFAQLFFYANNEHVPHDGRTLHDPEEVAAIFPDFAKQGLITQEGYLLFKTGKEALRFNTFSTPLHLDHMPPKEELYTNIDLERGYLQQPGEALVVQLEPAIKVPADVGVLLTKRLPIAHPSGLSGPFFNPAITDRTQVKAGWIDPGFPAVDKGPATVTAHSYRRGIPDLIKTGQLFAAGIVYKYDTPVQNPYGSEKLGSHYSNVQGLSGSRS